MAQKPRTPDQHEKLPEGLNVSKSPSDNSKQWLLSTSEAGASSSTPQINPAPPTISASPSTQETSGANGYRGLQADVLTEALRTSRSALETLLAKTHEIHEESWRAVQSLFEDLHFRLCRECEVRLTGFEKELDDRGRYRTSALLEIADVEVVSRLAARVDQALDKAQKAAHDTAQWLDEKVEISRANLERVTNTVAEELQQAKTVCLEHLEVEAQQRLSALRQSSIQELSESGQKAADSLNQVLTKASDETLKTYENRLQKLTDETNERLERRFHTLAEAAVAQVADEAQAIVTRETSAHLIQVLRSRLDQLANSLKD